MALDVQKRSEGVLQKSASSIRTAVTRSTVAPLAREGGKKRTPNPSQHDRARESEGKSTYPLGSVRRREGPREGEHRGSDQVYRGRKMTLLCVA